MAAASTEQTTEDTNNAPSEEAIKLTPEERHAQAERLVQQYSLGGAAVGLVPVPLFDMVALMAVQLKMLHSLAGHYDIDFKADLGRSAIASLLGGVLPTTLAASVGASLAKIVPGVGQLLGSGTQAVVGGAFTYAIGKVFIQHFAAGGTFLTFDPEAVRDYFEQQIEQGKSVVEELREKGGAQGRNRGTQGSKRGTQEAKASASTGTAAKSTS